jgi:hypothetical protein
MLFKDIIAVYFENHMKPINTLCGQNEDFVNVQAYGKYRYYCALKVKI